MKCFNCFVTNRKARFSLGLSSIRQTEIRFLGMKDHLKSYLFRMTDVRFSFTSYAICFRWRASIYKLVWLDLSVFLITYYSLSGIYRLLLNEDQKKTFEFVVAYCNEFSDLIPVSFILGFYVTIVMTRWWNQYLAIPWPDSIAVFVSATIHGNDERGRLMRRTILRYKA